MSAAKSLVTVTSVGFTIHDANGRLLAYEEHFEKALATQRELETAEDVRRVSDGVLCATKHRLKGESFWCSIWNMKTEPEWSPM